MVLDKIPRHWSKWYWITSLETLVQVVLDKIPRDTGPSGTGQDPCTAGPSGSLKCTKDSHNSRFFALNPNLGNTLETREREQFKVNFCRTKKYQDSAIPFCQRLLNQHWHEKEQGRRADQGAGGKGG